MREAFAQTDRRCASKEGESLQTDIVSRLETIRDLQERLAGHRDEIRSELLASYQQRVQEIAAQAGDRRQRRSASRRKS